MKAFSDRIAANTDFLTKLDSDIGDGDHGVNMRRGMQIVMDKLAAVADQDIGAIFKTVGMTLLSTVGGASGPLYGTFFLQMGSATAGKQELTLDEWRAGLKAGVEGIVMRGKASPGDKTMVDTLLPALDAIHAQTEGATLADMLDASARAAEQGMQATIPMLARKGRASYLGERSIGHQDPGATSAYYLLQTAAETLCDAKVRRRD